MSDNTVLNAGSGGDAVRAIDKGGAKTQVVALDVGGSGLETLVAGTVPVSGTVAVSGTVPVSGTFYQATQPISGTVAVSNLPTTQAVSGTVALDSASLAALETISVANFPATQAVSGTVGISGTVPVSGTFWQATQPVSIAATVNTNTGLSQPLTDTQLRASAVPVSAASLPLPSGASTDASLTGHAQTFKPVTAITAVSAANAAVTLTIPAAGVGLFTYITRLRITLHNTSATAVAGTAVTLAFTSTNIPGSLAWTEGNALAAGTSKVVVDEVLSQPLKTSVANTATTIVAPAAGAGVLVRITAYYYTGA